VYEAFTAKLVHAVAQLRVGDGLKGPTDQGPLIDTKALAKVEQHLADATAKGARIVLGGKRHASRHVLRADRGDRRDCRHVGGARETFGPVAPLFRFETESDAIRMANDTELDWRPTSTPATWRSWRVAEALEYGIVGLNTASFPPRLRRSGVKESARAARAQGTGSSTTPS